MKASYITPAVTALDEQRNLSFRGLEKLYEHLIAGGIDGILILGSIGEFFALPMEQKKQLISFAVKSIAGRVPLLVGTSGMVYDEIIELSDYAYEAGADAVMILPPYYFWLDDKGLEAYYDRIACRLQGNLYLYNFPDRTGYGISSEVVLRLRRKHVHIKGIKDTISGMDHTRELIRLIKPEFPDFEIYSGFDDNFAHNVLAGGDGCIGGLSNVAPEVFHEWVNAFRQNDLERVASIQEKVNRLMEIYTVGTPFVPYIKAAAELRGAGVQSYATFPLPVPSEAERLRLTQIMQRNELL